MNILVIITVTIVSFLAMPVNAQKSESDLSALLSKYYGIKNSLVTSDATGAAKQAMEFSAYVGKIDVKKLNVWEQQDFNNTKCVYRCMVTPLLEEPTNERTFCGL